WSPGGLEPRGNCIPGDLESRGRGGGASGRSWQILWEIVANAPDHDGGPAGAAASRCLLPGGCSRFGQVAVSGVAVTWSFVVDVEVRRGDRRSAAPLSGGLWGASGR